MEDNIIVLNFADIEIPEFRERIGDKHVRFGVKDDYPDYLAKLLNKSAKHGSIIKNKVTYIFGGGLKSTNSSPNAEAFIQQNKRLAKKIVFDLEAFGMTYIECIPLRNGKGFGYHEPYNPPPYQN